MRSGPDCVVGGGGGRAAGGGIIRRRCDCLTAQARSPTTPTASTGAGFEPNPARKAAARFGSRRGGPGGGRVRQPRSARSAGRAECIRVFGPAAGKKGRTQGHTTFAVALSLTHPPRRPPVDPLFACAIPSRRPSAGAGGPARRCLSARNRGGLRSPWPARLPGPHRRREPQVTACCYPAPAALSRQCTPPK